MKKAYDTYLYDEGQKMETGGLLDDSGKTISLKTGDIVVEYKKPTPNQEKRIIGGEGEIILIVGAMAKVFYKSTNYEQFIPLKDLKKVDKTMKTGGNIEELNTGMIIVFKDEYGDLHNGKIVKKSIGDSFNVKDISSNKVFLVSKSQIVD